MSIKLSRQYEMTIYPTQYVDRGTSGQFGQPITFSPVSGEAIQIKNPFTLIMNIRREAMSAINSATFQIYNLSQNTRNQLYRDKFSWRGLKRVTLKAGYASQGPLPIVFDGTAYSINSYRTQGTTNFITEIEAFDWDFPVRNALTSQSLSGKVKKQQIIDQLIKDIVSMGTPDHHMNRGYIHQYTNEELYYPVISEKSWDRLRTETENLCTIDNGNIHVLADNEYIPGANFTINSNSGLLGAPKRSETYVEVEMLFEPSLIVNQKVTLASVSQTKFNGDFKIYGINHTGIISDAVNGKCQTKLSLQSLQKNAQLMGVTNSLV